MRKILCALFIFICSCADSYREFKIQPLPDEMNTVYLKDSLRYLSLTIAEQNVLNATFAEKSVSDPVILTFPKEGIRVLIIKDRRHITQTVNIVPLYNGLDIYKAHNIKMIDSDLFTFQTNAYFYKIYSGIRKEIIRNLDKHYAVRINTLGSASSYGLMLAVEVSALQIPLESIVSFGPVRFASQNTHDQLKQSFGNRLVNITHDDDISHEMYMGKNYAEFIEGEYLVCAKKVCDDVVYTMENIPLQKLTKHISNFPHSYAQMYHDSILYMEEDEHRREM